MTLDKKSDKAWPMTIFFSFSSSSKKSLEISPHVPAYQTISQYKIYTTHDALVHYCSNFKLNVLSNIGLVGANYAY